MTYIEIISEANNSQFSTGVLAFGARRGKLSQDDIAGQTAAALFSQDRGLCAHLPKITVSRQIQPYFTLQALLPILILCTDDNAATQ